MPYLEKLGLKDIHADCNLHILAAQAIHARYIVIQCMIILLVDTVINNSSSMDLMILDAL